MFRIEHLTIGYEKVLLEGVNIKVEEKQILSLVGENGMGKSSLLRCIVGIQEAKEGKIFYKNHDLTKVKAKQRRKWISILFSQLPRRPLIKAKELLLIGNEKTKISDEIATEIISDFKLSPLFEKPLNTLSDGQFQRLMIARTLLQETPIILLDEPTSFLDYTTKEMVYHYLRKLSDEQKKIILIATHDLDLSRRYTDFEVDLSIFQPKVL